MIRSMSCLMCTLAMTAASCAPAIPVCDPPAEILWTPPEYDYVRVDFALESDKTEADTTAEVSSTPAYRAQLDSIKTVAIRAPNACLDNTAAEAEGKGKDSQVILKTTCAIYLKELERGLAGVGYRVVSWDVLDRAERAGGVSTYEAAANLGADAVFIVNSLETPQTDLGEDQEFRFAFFVSNPRGESVEPLELTSEEQEEFANRVLTRIPQLIEQRKAVKVLVATLDTTAVAVPSGESIWFYRRSLTEYSDQDMSKAVYRKFLFATTENEADYWGVWPEGAIKPATTVRAKANEKRSSSSFSLSRKGRTDSDNVYRQRQQAMVRKIVDEFALKFSNGEGEVQ